MTKELTSYEKRLLAWELRGGADCENYQKAKAFAKANGYKLSKDVSYNGYIFIKKEICTSEDPHDGNELEIQIYSNSYEYDKYHGLEQSDMEADFGQSILSKTTYRYKTSRLGAFTSTNPKGVHFASLKLEDVFEFALQREKLLNLEFAEFIKKRNLK